MLNLYEILEVSEKASKEIIEKAYRVLAKKYHPDLNPTEEKQNAEIKMKQINEAYEILSNPQKRTEYDLTLKKQRKDEINKKNNEEYVEKAKANYQEIYEKEEQIINNQREYNENMEKIQNEVNRAYVQAYNNYLRKLGYKLKKPWTWRRFIDLLKVFTILLFIILIIWFFPPTHKMLIEFYKSNVVIKTIIDIIGNIIYGIWQGIIKFFNKLFFS